MHVQVVQHEAQLQEEQGHLQHRQGLSVAPSMSGDAATLSSPRLSLEAAMSDGQGMMVGASTGEGGQGQAPTEAGNAHAPMLGQTATE